MATPHPIPDPIISVSDSKLTESDNMKEQPPSAKNERPGSLKSSQDAAAAIGHSVDTAAQSGSFGSRGDHSLYPPNVYAPQAQTFYYRGYDNPNGEWDEYSQFVNAEGLELGSPGIYNDNPSLVFHTGYGYSSQMPYGPYSPATPPLPSVGGDGQLYSPQQYPFSGTPYYQQLVSPTMPYSPTPVSQPDFSSLVGLDQQGDGMPFGPRPGYHPSLGTFGRGNFSGSSGTHGFHDLPQSYDGFRSGGLWSDWPKSSDRQRSFTPLSPAVPPQPIGRIGSFGQNVGMASQQHRSIYGLGSGSSSYNKGYLHSGFNPGSSFGSSSISTLGTNGRSWLADNSRQRGRGTSSLCSCNGTLDILSEQNRGPRASKPKSQIIGDHSSSIDSDKHITSTIKIHDESYNRPDFVTEFEDAKFFIIKSYSEDNVHKSIKYGIWASTPNGNRKLDAAYHESKEKTQGVCPVYLLFSVNASAQFCGVAEMVGPVDFDKSVDYWQQDKWSGQFPVKWHIIKDVPNSQFRHIVLENNDNKPVTNSRDTQEVKLDQGIELLGIFKNYETDMSILDDFDFYEDRQKAMQERKARQQASLMAVGVVEGNEHHNAVTLSTDIIKQMSKSFAQVVSLEESSKEGPVAQGSASAADTSSMGTRLKLEDVMTTS